MPRLTVSLSDERSERINKLAESDEYDSKSEVVNDLIDKGETVNQIVEENERLKQEKRKLIDQREEHDELVKWADEHRSLLEDEYRRRNAPIWRRLRWFVMGKED